MSDHRLLFDQHLAALPLIAILRGITPDEAVPVGEGAMAALLGADYATGVAIAEEAAQGQVCQIANDNGGGQVVLRRASLTCEEVALDETDHAEQVLQARIIQHRNAERERAEAAEVRRRAQWEALSPEARAAVWIALGEAT